MSLLSTITAYLPQDEGLLPKWLLFISITSLFNSIQCYLTLHFNSQIYNGPPKPTPSPSSAYPATTSATPLSSRTFGTWTLLTSLVRLSAAYNITSLEIYKLGYATFIVAWLHFMSEWWVFGTCRWGRGLAGPVFVSTGTMVWMWLQWDFYVQ